MKQTNMKGLEHIEITFRVWKSHLEKWAWEVTEFLVRSGGWKTFTAEDEMVIANGFEDSKQEAEQAACLNWMHRLQAKQISIVPVTSTQMTNPVRKNDEVPIWKREKNPNVRLY